MEAEREQPALRLLIQMLCFFFVFLHISSFRFCTKNIEFLFFAAPLLPRSTPTSRARSRVCCGNFPSRRWNTYCSCQRKVAIFSREISEAGCQRSLWKRAWRCHLLDSSSPLIAVSAFCGRTREKTVFYDVCLSVAFCATRSCRSPANALEIMNNSLLCHCAHGRANSRRWIGEKSV